MLLIVNPLVEYIVAPNLISEHERQNRQRDICHHLQRISAGSRIHNRQIELRADRADHHSWEQADEHAHGRQNDNEPCHGERQSISLTLNE